MFRLFQVFFKDHNEAVMHAATDITTGCIVPGICPAPQGEFIETGSQRHTIGVYISMCEEELYTYIEKNDFTMVVQSTVAKKGEASEYVLVPLHKSGDEL